MALFVYWVWFIHPMNNRSHCYSKHLTHSIGHWKEPYVAVSITAAITYWLFERRQFGTCHRFFSCRLTKGHFPTRARTGHRQTRPTSKPRRLEPATWRTRRRRRPGCRRSRWRCCRRRRWATSDAGRGKSSRRRRWRRRRRSTSRTASRCQRRVVDRRRKPSFTCDAFLHRKLATHLRQFCDALSFAAHDAIAVSVEKIWMLPKVDSNPWLLLDCTWSMKLYFASMKGSTVLVVRC